MPSSLAQTFEQVGVVFRPMPGDAVADIHVERCRSESDRLVQRLLHFCNVTELAERCSEIAMGCREFGKRPNQPPCSLDGAIVGARQIIT